MKGIVTVNAYYDAPPYRHQYMRIAEELKKLGADTEIVKNRAGVLVSDGEIETRIDCDFCVYLDKDKYASEMLEKSGVRLFNSHASIAACDDKMLTFIKLAGRGLPLPKTLPAPLCYRSEATITETEADAVARELGFPVIVKNSYGSMGKGVYKADDKPELLGLMNKLKLEPHLYQEFIATSEGKDVRVMVVGGKAVGAMLRTAQSGFRSNVGAGGKGEPYEPTTETAKLCEKAASALGLDFCGVDLLFGKNGFMICEVNSNAFFEEFEKVTGINVARLYAEHIITSIK